MFFNMRRHEGYAFPNQVIRILPILDIATVNFENMFIIVYNIYVV
jgi:hypothetical protein